MTGRENFVLKIMLQQTGMEEKDVNILMEKLESRNKTYKILVEAINRLQDYFINKRKYDKEAVCIMLKEPRIYECSIEKIKIIENVFAQRKYTDEEQQQISVGHPAIFLCRAEPLDKKLIYYNDIKIKHLLVRHSRHFMQSLSLTYARAHFLTDNELFEEKQKDLFLPEVRFIGAYGIEANNNKLKAQYPVKEAKYLIKK